MISKNTSKSTNDICEKSSKQPDGTRQTATPRRAEVFLSVVKYVVKADALKTKPSKPFKKKRKTD